MRTFAAKPAAAQQPASDTAILAGHVRLEGTRSPRLSPVRSLADPPRAAIQTKLAISTPGDEYEREADRVADQVMRMAEPATISPAAAGIQRQCAGCENDEEASPEQHAASLGRQGAAGQPDEEEPFVQSASQRVIQRLAQPTALATAATPAPFVADRLAHPAGGDPLPSGTRAGMERNFGHDFSRVRIHRDAEASEMNRELSALAFTHGSHIYFGHGTYDPQGSSGKRLLAHELTHVVQQGQAAPQPVGPATGPAVATAPRAPAIQRFALWRAGGVSEVNNLADAVVNGRPVGFTPPMFNNTVILSTAAARAVMRPPTISVTPAPGGRFVAKVTSSEINTGSFEEAVLAPGPWSVVAPRATIGALHPTLAACTGAGDSTFRAIGDPSDAHMYAANRRHEDHHATDHEAAFNSSVVPWDTNLLLAEVLDERFSGPTAVDAEAALWVRMGGTPDDIADKYFNEAVRLNDEFHATPAGGPVDAPTDPVANADCSTSSAKYHNPS